MDGVSPRLTSGGGVRGGTKAWPLAAALQSQPERHQQDSVSTRRGRRGSRPCGAPCNAKVIRIVMLPLMLLGWCRKGVVSRNGDDCVEAPRLGRLKRKKSLPRFVTRRRMSPNPCVLASNRWSVRHELGAAAHFPAPRAPR